MSQLILTPKSTLLGKTVGQVEQLYDVSVVLLVRGREADLHPNHTIALKAGDRITIFADVNTLHQLNHLNPA
jgi:Trk K+ transport system NAD-binding subunit